MERELDAGEYVARVGDPSAHWYGVMRGHLQMYVVTPEGNETTLYYLREGEWCGDGSLLKGELLQYDLRTLTTVHLCLVTAQTFNVLRNSSLEFSNFLCDVMNARMGVFVGMLAASRLLGPEGRVAKALLMLTKDRLEDTQRLSIHQHDLALICGLSRQRVNMALSFFKQNGIVHTDGPKGYLIVHTRRLSNYIGDL
ncbi:Crp/Fnr family transcriptional regulator [Rhodoferax sp. GW822-FHT02A01]|uniref:Crp/Fnr family transcriptional regulator n=1 Tax=Rhodoferax sp. GW822-FHT02A01 TaxID=3141537 RepID=UPI00315D6B56